MADSWNNTETKWYPIPVALGLGVIGTIQYRRVREREANQSERPKYVASGPWQVKTKHCEREREREIILINENRYT